MKTIHELVFYSRIPLVCKGMMRLVVWFGHIQDVNLHVPSCCEKW